MKTRKLLVLLTITALALAGMACNLLGAINSGKQEASPSAAVEETTQEVSPSTEVASTEAASPTEATANTQTVDSEFPLPANVKNLTKMDNGAVNFQVEMGLKDAMQFYLDELPKQGLKEWTLLHVEADNTFSLVFTGAKNDMDVVVQGVDLGGGTVNVNIRYDKVQAP